MKQKLLQLYFQIFGFLAKKYIKKHNPFVIGVTGSIGKTSSRMIISELLQQTLPEKIISTSSKNFNGELGLSLSVLGISDYEPSFLSVVKTFLKAFYTSFFGEKKYDIIFLEYGIDHIGEMDFLLSIVKPDIGIVTKIDKVHSSQFESKEVIASEKYKLLQSTKELSFLNADDEFAKKYESTLISNKIFYTTSGEPQTQQVDLKGLDYTLETKDGGIVSSFYFESDVKNKTKIVSNLIGQENIGYITIGLYIAEILNQKYYNQSFFSQIGEIFYIGFTLQYSRFSIFSGIENSVLIDSSYNAAPESMKKVMENFFLLSQKIYSNYEIILCLGEMRELGEYSKDEHEKLANFVKDKSKNIFVVGESMKKYFLPIVPNAIHFKNSKILGEFLQEKLHKDKKKYIILFKGSQNTIFMEEAVKHILLQEEDKKQICRQEDFWMEKKNKFFDK
ncbi:MAG: Mur ligase family protein [Candidatus Altimarinota bacterium]